MPPSAQAPSYLTEQVRDVVKSDQVKAQTKIKRSLEQERLRKYQLI